MPEPGGSIMHAKLRLGDSTTMLADEMPGMGSKSPATLGGSPIGFYVYVENFDGT
jgi:PhnB protein